MLPLTLRPTDIGTPPAFQHLKDYCVIAQFVVDEIARWAGPIKQNGLQID
jgi:hypothetical protein